MTDAKLAARVEALTGPCRETDALVSMEVMAGFGADLRGRKTAAEYLADFPHLCLEYTSSLDAAMTLLPGGFAFGCGRGTDVSDTDAWAWCSQGDEGPYAFAATPALALTAACLRAILKGQDDG